MEPEKLLTSPDLDLTSDNLKDGLGRWSSIYDALTERLSKPPYDISPEWRFYKDGGAWLCKMTRKKKTVFWISAWKQFLKCGFYFTAKSGDGISGKGCRYEALPAGQLGIIVLGSNKSLQVWSGFLQTPLFGKSRYNPNRCFRVKLALIFN